jgi:myosin heavy subunit
VVTNKDDISPNIGELLALQCDFDRIKVLHATASARQVKASDISNRGGMGLAVTRRMTICKAFSTSMSQLMLKLQGSETHYLR